MPPIDKTRLTAEFPLVFRTFVDNPLPGKKWCYNVPNLEWIDKE